MTDPSHTPSAPASTAPPSDFNIRPPTETTPAPATPLSSIPAQTSGTGTPINASSLPGEDGHLSSTDAVIGAAIMLALAIAIFFVRGAVRTHLIAHRASPSAAGNAGWALFALLLSVSVLIVFGLLGGLWSVLGFTIPLAVMILVTAILFVLLYRTAAQGRTRGRRPARR
ncbi:MAG: hypothetical protein ACRYGI_16440 [Janthinobacterium lividum]